jgi:thiamine transport system substrate-binding protein
MRRWVIGLLLLWSSLWTVHAADLVIYTYTSFNSEWGPGPQIFSKFEEQCQCKLQIITPGDSGAVLNRAILEKNAPRADVLLGVSDSELAKSFAYDLWDPYRSPRLQQVPAELQLDAQHRVTPFDHGYLAFIYDSEKIREPPQSFDDLLAERFRQKIVISSPQTSSSGLSLLHWTIAAKGEDGFLEYWERLQPNLLTVTADWDTAYGLFTRGEVPLVLSYITSPAYHLEYEQTERYRAAIFREGHYRQIEFVGVLKNAKHAGRARAFIDFLLSPEAQRVLPTTNWMYPAIAVSLPASYRVAPEPPAAALLPLEQVQQRNAQWLRQWSRQLSQ